MNKLALTQSRRSKNIEDRRIWTPEDIQDVLLGVGNERSIPTTENLLPGWRTDKEALSEADGPRELPVFGGGKFNLENLYASKGVQKRSPEELEHQALVMKAMGEIPGENTKHKRDIVSQLITMSSRHRDNLRGYDTDYGNNYYMSDETREALYRYLGITRD